jgi:hypothetical protein
MSNDVSEEHIASIFRVKNKPSKLATCFHAGLFLGLLFDPEDGGDISSETPVDIQRTT